jgi:hypothetical protein
MKKLALLIASVVALCGFGGVASGPDPFFVPDGSQIYTACNGSWACNAPYTATTGRTVRNLTINTGIRNLVLFVMGQSNNESEAPSAYTATNASAIDELNVYDGAIYAAAEPHLGTSYNGSGPGLMDYRVADTLITNAKFDRVILVPMAIGGTNAAQWANGGVIQNLPCVAMARLAARGITPATTNVTFAADWGQGEAESGLSTTQVAYQGYMTQIATNLNACGFSGRFFVNVETWGGGAVYATVQAAQAAVVGTTIGNVAITAGANLDTLNNTNRVDTTHFNDTGSAAGAALKVTAWHASGAPF